MRKLTDDHPLLIQNLVAIESEYDEANKLLTGSDYRGAMAGLEGVSELITKQRDLIGRKEAVKNAYDRFLVLIEQVEPSRPLAPFEYEKAVSFGAEGEMLLSNGDFPGATRTFEMAIDAVNEMEIVITDLLVEREVAGKRALSRGNGEEALAIFLEILELQPDNELAIRNLKRAETIHRVYPLLQEATQRERSGEFAASLDAYTEAFALDGQSLKAQQGKARVHKIIRDNRFEELMSRADKAKREGDWDTAIIAYSDAVDEFPDNADLPGLLDEAREEGHNAKVKAGLSKAYAFENQFAWIYYSE